MAHLHEGEPERHRSDVPSALSPSGFMHVFHSVPEEDQLRDRCEFARAIVAGASGRSVEAFASTAARQFGGIIGTFVDGEGHLPAAPTHCNVQIAGPAAEVFRTRYALAEDGGERGQ